MQNEINWGNTSNYTSKKLCSSEFRIWLPTCIVIAWRKCHGSVHERWLMQRLIGHLTWHRDRQGAKDIRTWLGYIARLETRFWAMRYHYASMHETGTSSRDKCVPYQTFVGENSHIFTFINSSMADFAAIRVLNGVEVYSCRICSLDWKDYTIDNQNATPFVGEIVFCNAAQILISKLLWKEQSMDKHFHFIFVEISSQS